MIRRVSTAALALSIGVLVLAPAANAAEKHLDFRECKSSVRTNEVSVGSKEIDKGRHEIAVPDGQSCVQSREIIAVLFAGGQSDMPAGLASWKEIPGVGDLVTTSEGDEILISEGKNFPNLSAKLFGLQSSPQIGDCMQTAFGPFLVSGGANTSNNGSFFARTDCTGRGDRGTWVTGANRDEAAMTCFRIARGAFDAIAAGGQMGPSDWFCQALQTLR